MCVGVLKNEDGMNRLNSWKQSTPIKCCACSIQPLIGVSAYNMNGAGSTFGRRFSQTREPAKLAKETGPPQPPFGRIRETQRMLRNSLTLGSNPK